MTHQENHFVEVPNDGDLRWDELVSKRAKWKVLAKYAPLPEGPVAKMDVAFIVRNVRARGLEETVYLIAKKDTRRLLALKINWAKADKYLLSHPKLSTLQFIEKVEQGKVKL